MASTKEQRAKYYRMWKDRDPIGVNARARENYARRRANTDPEQIKKIMVESALVVLSLNFYSLLWTI